MKQSSQQKKRWIMASAVVLAVLLLAYYLASPQGLVAMMNGENPLPGFDRLGIAVPPFVAEEMTPVSSPAWPGVDAASNPVNQAGRGDRSAAQLATPQAQPDAALPTPAEAKRPWRLHYEGLNRVVIQRQLAQAGDPYLLMHRRGLFGWQVVDVNLGRLW